MPAQQLGVSGVLATVTAGIWIGNQSLGLSGPESVEAERHALRDLQRERAFPADVLRTVQREIDLDESRVEARARD